ncbi:cobalamin biosynthesis protein CobD [Paenibacillus athensensis]|uniref:Cobalamin biosynthesis protein CobD n=1 Tax=Paenibacillus athensensis TaxID=1967502 RepID=A0A4Y8PS20_9BACL|nr:adenosylcobinamide-phosphate synthase CbiB [Paenibacillus athensensis]MCD1262011.1 cobalamin biosynthesis protein CobD [Paenibacillus athensensis]
MWMYSWHELIALTAAALALDLLIGDPKWPTHPVIYIGRWVRFVERKLRPRTAGGVGGKADAGTPPQAGANSLEQGAAVGTAGPESTAAGGSGREEAAASRLTDGVTSARAAESSSRVKWQGVVLTGTTVLLSFGAMYGLTLLADWVHPWLGYAVSIWFIASTIAVKGLKQAAYRVYEPLRQGDLEAARKYTGYIVGRDTAALDEKELTRAVVETVAENIVDAVIAPLLYAALGGAPLAMAYRAANTLDSMVGYRNDAYRDFGWASARWDDVLNWVPARLTGALMVGVALLTPGLSAQRAARAIRRFARLHPSPNSGIPESAAAGALGIELGGLNVYGGVPSERARMGWPMRERTQRDIDLAVRMLYGVSLLAMGGLLCVIALFGR